MNDDTLVEIFEWVIPTVILCLIGMVLLLLVDLAGAIQQPDRTATVIQTAYSPKSSSLGTAIGSNGKPMVVSQHKSEAWIVIVECDGVPLAACTSSQNWIKLKTGDTVTVRFWKGRIFGKVLSPQIVE